MSMRNKIVAVSLFCAALQAFAEPPEREATGMAVEVAEIPQDFAFDMSGDVLFLQSIRKDPRGDLSGVSRYAIDNGSARLIDSTPMYEWLGHQGISIESINSGGQFWLWGSKAGYGGREAVRFVYSADAQQPSGHQTYVLFGSKFSRKNTVMPKVCNGRQWLVARGRTRPREQVIRLFDLEMLVREGPADYSERYMKEWNVPSEALADGSPLQGMACDGAHVYLLVGNARLNDSKRLVMLNIEGSRAAETVELNAGRAYSVAVGTAYEPEGIAVRQSKDGSELHVGIISGKGRRKEFRIWRLENSISR